MGVDQQRQKRVVLKRTAKINNSLKGIGLDLSKGGYTFIRVVPLLRGQSLMSPCLWKMALLI